MPKDPAIPPVILSFMQNPPLLKGESTQQYNELLGILVSQVAPVDIIEWLWVAHSDEVGRGYRAKAAACTD